MKDAHLKIHWLNSHKHPKAEPTLESYRILPKTDFTRRENIWYYSIQAILLTTSIVSFLALIIFLDYYYIHYLA